MQPSIWQKCAYTFTSTSNNTPEQHLHQHHHAPYYTSTPNYMPSITWPSSSQNSIHQHPKLQAITRPSISQSGTSTSSQAGRPLAPDVKLAKQHPPAPQTARPLAPGRQSRKVAAPQTTCPLAPNPKLHAPPATGRHQHPQLHAPQHPAVKLAKQHLTSTPNCVAAIALAKQHLPQHPKLHRQSRKAAPPPAAQARSPAPQTTCPPAPGRHQRP